MMKKYAIHEGFVTSKNDGERHFITFTQLCYLYRLNPRECLNWVKSGLGNRYEDFIHLFPRYDGDYVLPENKEGS